MELSGCACFDYVITYIGFIYVVFHFLKIVFSVFNGIRVHFLPKLFPPVDLKSRYGQWAVVTGGTDGIGKAYARELARRGVNVALVSIDKLAETAAELENEFGIKTKSIQVDFSVGESVYENIKNQLKDIEIGILINNVGVAVPYPMRVCEMTSSQLKAHVNVNVGAATFMTSMLLPEMLRRRRGAIVNVASISALGPWPYIAVYAATKAYVESFSLALQFEYRDSGVHIQTLTPSFVNTRMTEGFPVLTQHSLNVPTAAVFVKNAINTLGRTSSTTGYWPHGIQYWLLTLIDRSPYTYLSGMINLYFRKQHNRLKKASKSR